MTRVKVYQPTYIHQTAKIGDGTKIGAFCDIGKDVKIGKNCNIQCHVSISNGTIIGNNVFLGPKVTILNDKYIDGNLQPVKIRDDVRVGGGALILPNVIIGKGALVGAGSIVTRDVKPYKVVYGNPARERGELNDEGKLV